jgi:hypothetical protein
MCGEGIEVCELTRQLTNLLIGLDATLEKVRRAAPDAGAVSEDLRAMNEAFKDHIQVARRLSMTVHLTCARCHIGTAR